MNLCRRLYGFRNSIARCPGKISASFRQQSAFIPASNESSGRACTASWRMPRGSNTPLLCSGVFDSVWISRTTRMPAALPHSISSAFVVRPCVTVHGFAVTHIQ